MKGPYYNLDDLFKTGDIILDKESGKLFRYIKSKHKELLRKSPNNFRLAHTGDGPEVKKYKKFKEVKRKLDDRG